MMKKMIRKKYAGRLNKGKAAIIASEKNVGRFKSRRIGIETVEFCWGQDLDFLGLPSWPDTSSQNIWNLRHPKSSNLKGPKGSGKMDRNRKKQVHCGKQLSLGHCGRQRQKPTYKLHWLKSRRWSPRWKETPHTHTHFNRLLLSRKGHKSTKRDPAVHQPILDCRGTNDTCRAGNLNMQPLGYGGIRWVRQHVSPVSAGDMWTDTCASPHLGASTTTCGAILVLIRQAK